MENQSKIKTEKEYENHIVSKLNSDDSSRGLWVVDGKTGKRENLNVYLGLSEYEVVQDSSIWNKSKNISTDLIGGMTPDISIISRKSQQTRILIEVKWTAKLHYFIDESQLIRYFIFLLSSTEKKPNGKNDLKRAVLLAAPQSWYKKANLEAYSYFIDMFYDVAKRFDIQIGKLESDALNSNL